MAKYRKKPVEIDAIEWTGENFSEILKFSGDMVDWDDAASSLFCITLEGNLYANVGDMIIKGVAGEVYACKKHIFDQTYDEVK